MRQTARDFIASQDDGEALRRPRLLDPFEPRQLDAQHFLVQEEQRALGLILRGSGDLPDDGEIGQERLQHRWHPACWDAACRGNR